MNHSTCAWCKTPITHGKLANGNTTHRSPQPGHMGSCFECGNVVVFMEGGATRRITTEEKKSLPEPILVHIAKVAAAVAARLHNEKPGAKHRVVPIIITDDGPELIKLPSLPPLVDMDPP